MTDPTPDESRFRYFDLRYDGERTLSGIALHYGDLAETPWGDREKFDPGSFRSVSSSDVILNVMHDRSKPISRTGGGGLEVMDSPTRLEIKATIPETTDGNNALENVRKKILRGLSIEFRPKKSRLEGTSESGYTTIIEHAELRAIGLVDRPAYKQSVITSREEIQMEENKIKELIDKALAVRSTAEPTTPTTEHQSIDTAALATQIALSIGSDLNKRVEEGIDTALKARAEAETKAEDDEDEDETMMEDKKKMKKKMEDKKKMKKKVMDDEDENMMEASDEEHRKEIEEKAEQRAELIVQVKELMPKEFEFRGKNSHEILVAACGDEVPKAEDRSEDYLQAKVEGIIERRSLATTTSQIGGGSNTTTVPASSGGAVNLVRMIENRNRTLPGTQQGV